MDLNASYEIMKKYYAGNDEAKKKIIEDNKEAIISSNKVARKLLRVGLPWSVRMDQASDEIPFVAGLKRVWTYGGAGIAWALGGIFGYNYFFGK